MAVINGTSGNDSNSGISGSDTISLLAGDDQMAISMTRKTAATGTARA